MSGLLHDIFAGKAIAALAERLYQCLRERVSVDVEAIAKISIGIGARDWKAKTGRDAYVANYYNAEMVFVTLARALEKTGQPINGENLLKQRRATVSFDLVGGRMEFLPNSSVSMPIQINEIDGGAGKLVRAGTLAK